MHYRNESKISSGIFPQLLSLCDIILYLLVGKNKRDEMRDSTVCSFCDPTKMVTEEEDEGRLTLGIILLVVTS